MSLFVGGWFCGVMTVNGCGYMCAYSEVCGYWYRHAYTWQYEKSHTVNWKRLIVSILYTAQLHIVHKCC